MRGEGSSAGFFSQLRCIEVSWTFGLYEKERFNARKIPQ